MVAPTRLLRAGRFRVPERWVVPGGGWNVIDVPALFAWVRHPTMGDGLIDTGCSVAFATLTRNVPLEGYRLVSQVRMSAEEGAGATLARAGGDPGAIRWIALTHLDPDHVGGLVDFPNARFVLHPDALEAARGGLSGQVRGRVFPRHLPEDFATRATPIPEGLRYGPFPWSHDLFGDGAIVAVPLPGHALGQVGFLVQVADRARWFLCGDAVWSRPGLAQRGIFHEAIAYDRSAQARSRAAIAEVLANDDVTLVPAHCPFTALELASG